ncbi:MAG: hypothetical protein MUD10_01625 [Candidatus Pacebacteria bacterium]|jgi:hypothetical protein|nr:hypothetical protein [Candidatus Paceibacterota bacterium]
MKGPVNRDDIIAMLADKARHKKILMRTLSYLIERGTLELREPQDFLGLRRSLDSLESLGAVSRELDGGKIIYSLMSGWSDETIRELLNAITENGPSGYKYALYVLLTLRFERELVPEEILIRIARECRDASPSLSAINNSIALLMKAGIVEKNISSYFIKGEWREKLRQ